MFSDRQKQVTQQCVASQNKDYWIIGSQGARLRPSNWPERIASTFMLLEEFSSRRKIVSQCVSQMSSNGRSCLKVRKAFQQGCREGWNYVLNFARANQLSIIDNHGQSYREDIAPVEASPLDDITLEAVAE